MEKLAVCEKSYEDFHVCCIATEARNNALRTGVDVGGWVEKSASFQVASGTINIVLLTNVVLTEGAMARAIMTATELKPPPFKIGCCEARLFHRFKQLAWHRQHDSGFRNRRQKHYTTYRRTLKWAS